MKNNNKPIFTLSKVLDGIYNISFDTCINLGAHFLRYQEYYESPKYRDVPFQLIDFIKWYSNNKTGKFTYFSDWTGFNIPAQKIIELYPKITDVNDHDEFMFLIAKSIIKENDKAYLIGTSQDTKQAFDHEIAHGLFYTNLKYQSDMKRLVRKLPSKIRKYLQTFLSELGYHECVFIDEIQAYMSTGLPGDIEIQAKYKSAFKRKFYKYNSRSVSLP